MRRSALSLLILGLVAPSASAATPPELFTRAKEQFRLASYAEALRTLDELGLLVESPGLEKDRAALRAPMAFYRGASQAALGRPDEARAEFEVFLAYQPNASLDPAIYPAKVVAALEAARKSLIERGSETAMTEDPAGSLAVAYRSFRADIPPEGSLGEDWAEGPVRFLLTTEERKKYISLGDPVSRSDYVTHFWKSKDVRPETPENEFRMEFERRVAFADSRLTQEETRGSLTDRGMVFLLLGPPTYAGRKPLATGEDTGDPSALKKFRSADVRIAAQPGGTTTQRAARIDAVTGPGTRINEAAQNWREVWHYRREALPKEVPFQQVDFEFVTRRGYGENVLQRDPMALQTLDLARKIASGGLQSASN
jgi:GWxTD domain-containing protein